MKEKKKANVLLVDGDKISRMFYSAILENYSVNISANIYEAESGASAKKIIFKLEERQDRFDLAIIYQKLEDMPGREICQLIREKNENAKIIAATTNPCNYRLNNAKEEGFDNYLVKPVTVQRFLEVIQN